MASPFKRICLQAAKSQTGVVSRQRASQWQPIRTISSTSSRQASSNPSPDDAFLDSLTNQPGVKYSTTEDPDDLMKVDMDNMSAVAHRELEQHRELREMMRLAAWEMPLLSSMSKPFEPPKEEQVLRWRYTTYLGETHPAARKVVVEFRPELLPDFTPEQRLKLLKLAGARCNPSRQKVKLSCDSFETQAQNKRYLADVINNLIAESKDPQADAFADTPLDTRHHKPRKVYKFPESWIITSQRRAHLEEMRKAGMLEDGKRIEEDRLVSGVRAIEEARMISAKQVEEPVMAEARQRLPQGKMGRKEMGQTRGSNRP